MLIKCCVVSTILYFFHFFPTNSGDVYGEGLLKIQQKLLDIEREKLQVQKELFEIRKAELVIKQQKHQVNIREV